IFTFGGDSGSTFGDAGAVSPLQASAPQVANAAPSRGGQGQVGAGTGMGEPQPYHLDDSSSSLYGAPPDHSKAMHKEHFRHKSVEPVATPAPAPVVQEVVQRAVPVREDLDGRWHAAPQLTLQYRRYSQEAYTEAGAGALNLVTSSAGFNMFQTGLGARFF